MTSLLSVSKPLAPLGEWKSLWTVFNVSALTNHITFPVDLDTLDDFYNSSYQIGSSFPYRPIPFTIKLGKRYDDKKRSDVEGAYEKLKNGTYTFYDSRQNLRYLMRSQFTNE